METPSSSAAEALRLEKADLRGVLEDAVAQRGRYYHNILTFAIRSEGDNTSAHRDTINFQAILKMLKLPKAREHGQTACLDNYLIDIRS